MSGEEELYDEFGNYVGPDLGDDSSDDDSDDNNSNNNNNSNRISNNAIIPDDASDVSGDPEQLPDADPINAIVLHEDKVHYPSADEVYGQGVRTAVLDEDAMDLNVPLVEPVATKAYRAEARDDWVFRDEYLSALFGNDTTRTRRGVAIVGHLHCGKTTLIDALLESSFRQPWGPRAALNAQDGGGPRYCDVLESEQSRQMSLVSTPLTTILPDTRGKSFLITMVDCPGHVHFHDESVAALRAVDGAVIVVDAVEGIMMHTEMVVKQAISEGLPITMVINKVDRLIIDLKLPPRDSYYKLLNLVEGMNDLIGKSSNGKYPKLSPAKNNVAFASAQHGWCFTLKSFAQLYLDHLCEQGLGNNLSTDDFALRLWGDAYLNPDTRTFHKSSRTCPGVERTFCTLVLGPLYKIYTACLGEHQEDVNTLLRQVGVLLTKDQLRASAKPLLRSACSRFFANATAGFVDMLVQHVPSPAGAAKGKVARCYTGPMDSHVAASMVACDATATLMIHCVKMYAADDGQTFSVLGRIYSGTVAPGDRVKVLGEGYSPEDDEDMALATVTSVSIPRGRSRTEVTRATAGNWVLLDGIDATVSKTATLTSVGADDGVEIFAPLKFPQVCGKAVCL
jgi:116 kDa U5 small nuclear ribonucleoprotein component